MATRKQIDRFRHFNRFYTNYIGLLGDHLYNSPVNLSEARVLFELDARPGASARDLTARLGLDKGYLSRMLKRFLAKGWIEEAPSQGDARVKELRLADDGHDLMKRLHLAASNQADLALSGMPPENRTRLLKAMQVIETILSA